MFLPSFIKESKLWMHFEMTYLGKRLDSTAPAEAMAREVRKKQKRGKKWIDFQMTCLLVHTRAHTHTCLLVHTRARAHTHTHINTLQQQNKKASENCT
jgi:hypothetical protein